MPRETIAYLLDLDIPLQFIQGNGDREVLAQMRGTDTGTVPERFLEVMRWVAQQLQPSDEQLLAGWPETLRLRIQGLGEVLFCHATPRSDTEIFTRLTPEDRLLPVFEGLDVPVIVCGHTHMQFDRTIGRVRVVNAGSVGMPFAEPGAYWLLLGPGVQLRRTSYDLTEAADRIRNTKYPQADDFAARNVLQPPSERETLEAFGRVELK
jgi:predicted phosphodiesterase